MCHFSRTKTQCHVGIVCYSLLPLPPPYNQTGTHPFHTIVAAVDIVSVKSAFELGPESNPNQPAGIPLSTVADPVYK